MCLFYQRNHADLARANLSGSLVEQSVPSHKPVDLASDYFNVRAAVGRRSDGRAITCPMPNPRRTGSGRRVRVDDVYLGP